MSEARAAEHVYKLVRQDWNGEAQAWLSRIPWNDCYPLQYLQRDIQNEAVVLFHALVDGVAVGCCVLRVENTDMVVMAAAGDFGSVGNMMEFCELIETYARLIGKRFIRWHVERQGLVRIAERHGYELDEIVMRKAIA